MRSGVPVLLSQTKVDDVDEVALFAQTHEKVVRLNIAVDEVFRMNVLNAVDLGNTNSDNYIISY